MKKVLIILAIVMSFALTGCSVIINGKEVTSFDFSGGSIPAEKTEVKEQAVDTQDRVSVSNIAGRIDIKTWDGNSVKVTAVKEARSSSKEKAEKLLDEMKVNVNKSSNSIDVSVDYATRFTIRNRSVRLEVLVPANIKYLKGNSASGEITLNGFNDAEEFDITSISGSVEVQDTSVKSFRLVSTSGEIYAEGVKGDGYVKSISGTIELNDMTGDLDCKSTSGRISGDVTEGTVNAETISGSIEFNEANLKSDSYFHSVSGSMNIEAVKIDSEGTYKISSISGSVNLQLPQDSGFSLNAKSVSGSISNDFSGSFDTARHRVTGKVGNGGAEIDISTTSGSISIDD